MNEHKQSKKHGESSEDPELDGLVGRFAHRVGYFTRRIERRFGLDPSERDDLISAGYWGLLKALRNRRDDAHAHELSAYVSKRVEGAVLDEARNALRRVSKQTDCDPGDLDLGLSVDNCSPDWQMVQTQLGPEELADRRGRWRRIERSFDHLAREHQNLLIGYASGRSLAEIARSDGASPARLQNQMSKITRAVRAHSPELRRLLRNEI